MTRSSADGCRRRYCRMSAGSMPDISIPRRACPITGEARVNSERWRCRIAWGSSGTASDEIDFDDAAACQMRDPDCGPRWQPVGPEILGVESVEGSVVALEGRKKYAHANNIFEPGAGAGERAFEIIHHFAGLRLNSFRKRQRIIIRIGGELASHEEPTIRLDDMAVRRHRLRRVRDQMINRRAHDRSPRPRPCYGLPLRDGRQMIARIGVRL